MPRSDSARAAQRRRTDPPPRRPPAHVTLLQRTSYLTPHERAAPDAPSACLEVIAVPFGEPSADLPSRADVRAALLAAAPGGAQSPCSPGLEPGASLWDAVLHSAAVHVAAEGADADRRLPLCSCESDGHMRLRLARTNSHAFAGAAREVVQRLEAWVTRSGQLTMATTKKGDDDAEPPRHVIDGVEGGGLLATVYGWDLHTEDVGRDWIPHSRSASAARTYRERRDVGRGYSILWQLVSRLPSERAAPRADLEGASGLVMLLNAGDERVALADDDDAVVTLDAGQMVLAQGDAAYRAADASSASPATPLLRGLLLPVEYELLEHDGVTDAARAASRAHNLALPPFPTHPLVSRRRRRRA